MLSSLRPSLSISDLHANQLKVAVHHTTCECAKAAADSERKKTLERMQLKQFGHAVRKLLQHDEEVSSISGTDRNGERKVKSTSWRPKKRLVV